ncbi:MAG: hypothetical protein JSS27_08135 [Planctomycetes bacterium]|nr:hypothetical protein [Planctomycetota bacterium]
MPISVACPECGRHLKAPDALQGKRARCPRCRHVVDVPAVDAPANVAEVVAESHVAVSCAMSEAAAQPPAEALVVRAVTPEIMAPVVEPAAPVVDPVIALAAAESPLTLETAPTAVEPTAATPMAAPAPETGRRRSHHERLQRVPVAPWEEHHLPRINPEFDLPRRVDLKEDAATPSAPARPAAVIDVAANSDGATPQPKAKDPSEFLRSGDWPKLSSPPPPNSGFLVPGHEAADGQASAAPAPPVTDREAGVDGNYEARDDDETSPDADGEYGGAPLAMSSNPWWRSKIAALFSLAVLVAAGWLLLQPN